jgi:hypothetical protein
VWYRLSTKIITAGKKEVIQILGDDKLFETIQDISPDTKYQTTAAYFLKSGINREQIQEYIGRLAKIDERKKVDIFASPKGVRLNNENVDWIKFTEVIDGIYNTINTREKPRNIQEQSVIDGKITVTKAENAFEACKLGVKAPWCISQQNSGMFQSYRDHQQSTFYFVNDGTQPEDSPLRRVVVDMNANGVLLTDLYNTTGHIHQFGGETKPYFDYLESQGVDISQFVNDPITKEEIEETRVLGEEDSDLEWFKKLSFDYKSKYIGRGHELSTEQLFYLANMNADDLIFQYLNTGRKITPESKEIISKKKQWIDTYARARKIYFDSKDELSTSDIKELLEFPDGKEYISQNSQAACRYAYEFINGRFPEGEAAIAKDALTSYYYARDVIHVRFPEGEPIISQNAEFAYKYAREIIKGRWREVEDTISKEPDWAYAYAKDVIKGRWPEAEKTIASNVRPAFVYARDIIKGRWPEAEQAILNNLKNNDYIFAYAREVVKGRWLEAEPVILQNPQWTYDYAHDIIKGRWPEGEHIIAQDAGYAYQYATYVIKERFPEGEPAIAKRPILSLSYAKNVIKGRFPEGEAAIAQDADDSYQYAVKVLKGRFPEGEPVIAKDVYNAYQYAVDVIRGRFPEGEPEIAKNSYYAYYYAVAFFKGRWPEAEPAIMADKQMASAYSHGLNTGQWKKNPFRDDEFWSEFDINDEDTIPRAIEASTRIKSSTL